MTNREKGIALRRLEGIVAKRGEDIRVSLGADGNPAAKLLPMEALALIAGAIDRLATARDHVAREARECERAALEEERGEGKMQCGACARVGTNDTRPTAHSPNCSKG